MSVIGDKILKQLQASAITQSNFIADDLVRELEGQAHVSTRKLISSIEVLDRFIYGVVQVDIEFEDYYVYVEYGVSASQIKYKFAKQRINALKNWWMRHGLSEKEALGAAYGTAAKHAKEGMPTESSKYFAANHRRLHFIDETIDHNKYIEEYEDTLLDILENSTYEMLDNLPEPFIVTKT